MGRIPEIVVPEIGYEFTACHREAGVVRSRLVSRVFRKIMPAQTRIVKRCDDLRGTIGAAVADNEHLEISGRLPQHRLDRVAQDAAPIIGRSDDADVGRLRHLITNRAFARSDTGFDRFPAAADKRPDRRVDTVGWAC